MSDVLLPASVLTQPPSVILEGSVVQSGSVVTMQKGTASITARDLVTIHAEDVTISAWHGAFDISADAQKLTIAALTTPVLLTKGTRQWIIPASMQGIFHIDQEITDEPYTWIDDVQLYPMPAHYMEERLPVARRIMSAFKGVSLSETSPLFELHKALVDGHLEQARTLLMQPGMEMNLRTADESLRSDMYVNARALGLENVFLAFLAGDSKDLQMLTLAHPLTRADAWVLPHENNLTEVLMLIPSDRLEDAVPQLVIDQWAAELAQAMDNAEDMNVFASATFPAFHEMIAALRDAGYPHRSKQYAQAIVNALHKDIRSLNDDARASFASIETLAHGDVPVAEEVVLPVTETGSVSASETVDVVSININEAVATLRANLAGYGAMFTSKTLIAPNTSGRIQVDGLVIATAHGDTLLRFTYNPASDEVENIEHDGKILPYSLSLEKYVEWVKGK